MKKIIHIALCLSVATLVALIARYAALSITGDVRPTGSWGMMIAVLLIAGPATVVCLVSVGSSVMLARSDDTHWPVLESILACLLYLLFGGPDSMQAVYGALPESMQVLCAGLLGVLVTSLASWHLLGSIRAQHKLRVAANAVVLVAGVLALIVLGGVIVAG